MTASILLLLFTSCVVLAQYDEQEVVPSPSEPSRVKRGVAGALHIVTNNAHPIHTDVKPEGDATEHNSPTPCPEGIKPSHIESGVGFKVTPPEDVVYEVKSLRKSLPHYGPPSTLDLLRSISRVVTLLILFITAVCEFYPTFHSLIMTIYHFIDF